MFTNANNHRKAFNSTLVNETGETLQGYFSGTFCIGLYLFIAVTGLLSVLHLQHSLAQQYKTLLKWSAIYWVILSVPLDTRVHLLEANDMRR